MSYHALARPGMAPTPLRTTTGGGNGWIGIDDTGGAGDQLPPTDAYTLIALINQVSDTTQYNVPFRMNFGAARHSIWENNGAGWVVDSTNQTFFTTDPALGRWWWVAMVGDEAGSGNLICHWKYLGRGPEGWETNTNLSASNGAAPSELRLNRFTNGDPGDFRYANFKLFPRVMTLAEIERETWSVAPLAPMGAGGIFWPFLDGPAYGTGNLNEACEAAREYMRVNRAQSNNAQLTFGTFTVSANSGLRLVGRRRGPLDQWLHRWRSVIGVPEYGHEFRVPGGATTVERTFLGTLTSAGALVRQAQQLPGGAVTPAGALTRQAQQLPAGAITPAGALARQTDKAMAGAVTPSGTLATVRTVLLALAGTLTSSGALVRQTAKAVAGSVASAGQLTRQTVKAMAGTLSFAGALTVIRTVLLALAGTLTSAGALVRQTQKPVAGSATPGGTLTRQAQKPLAGSVSFAGALTAIRTVLASFAGVLSFAGSMVRQTDKPLAGSATPAGALTKQVQTSYAGSVSPTGALTALRTVLLSVAGTVTFAGALTREAVLSFAGSVSPAGSLARLVDRTFAGAVTFAGALVTATTFARAFSGAVGFAGSLATLLLTDVFVNYLDSDATLVEEVSADATLVEEIGEDGTI